MRWCRSCILPDTRPNLVLDEDGVCSLCRARTKRPMLDWTARELAFRELVARIKSLGRAYDCVIPVSGGKDSTWQVVTCLEYGLKPLAVTWRTPVRTEIGWRNLDNLIALGVDHVDFTINPNVERAFMRKSFERAGSCAIPMHLAIYNIPLKAALNYSVPLIVWGENSASEYSGQADDAHLIQLDRAWLAKFGVTQGTTAEDWCDETLSIRDLAAYRAPDPDAFAAADIQALFLGDYFQWDPQVTLNVAREHGFQASQTGPRTGYYEFADIDDDFISIHHWMKWYKFGFTRLFDNLSLEIRNGRMIRERAAQIACELGEQRPVDDIKLFCEFTSMTESRFQDIAETFRNRDIWNKKNGTWMIDEFLSSEWRWV